MKPELKAIVEECNHPTARHILEKIFEADDTIKQKLYAKANDLVRQKRVQQAENTFDGIGEIFTNDYVEGNDTLDELGSDLLNRYTDRSQAQVRKGSFGLGTTGTIKQKTKKRMNRVSGSFKGFRCPRAPFVLVNIVEAPE